MKSSKTKTIRNHKRLFLGVGIAIVLSIPAIILFNKWWTPLDQLEQDWKQEIQQVVGDVNHKTTVTKHECHKFDKGFVPSGRVCDYYVVVQLPGISEAMLRTKAEHAGWNADPRSVDPLSPPTISMTKDHVSCELIINGEYFPYGALASQNYNGYEFDCQKTVFSF